MPDFEQRKRRSLTDRQLYEEYQNYGKSSSLSSAQKKKKQGGKKTSQKSQKPAYSTKTSANNARPQRKETSGGVHSSENRHVSEVGGRNLSRNGENHSSAGPKKTSPISGRSREQTEKAVAAAKKSKTFAGKKSNLLKGKPTKSGTRKNSDRSRGRKRRQGKYTLYYIFLGVVVIIALSVLSATVLFNIGVFAVNGETRYSDEEIIEACGIEKGENLLRVNTGRGAEQIVEKLVYIESAEIHRGFPNRLSIIVRPAIPVAAFNYGGKYYVTSEGNRLLEISDTAGGYPIVRGFSFDPQNMPAEGDYLSDDEENRLVLVNTITSGLSKNGLDKSCVINVTDTLELKVTYDDRIEITLGTSTGLENKIYNASLAIKDDIADNERCTLYFINQDSAVKRPIRENGDDGYVVPEETTAPEDTAAPEEGTQPAE